jgi:predicted Zn-dependent protease
VLSGCHPVGTKSGARSPHSGNVLLLKGDSKGALEAFRTAIMRKPDCARAYYKIGNALLGDKQPDEAARIKLNISVIAAQ